MIPKIIHYCWFGGKALPEEARRCIESWRKYCPDYEIRRWDESNYDYRRLDYTREAYEAQKWAFVTDVARLEVVYHHGGIYLDTDVELLKPLDAFLEEEAFMGFEGGRQVNTGLGFGAEKGHPVIAGNLSMYAGRHFLNPDGSMNLLPCPGITTMYLQTLGLRREDVLQRLEGMTVYPSPYFSPLVRMDGSAETVDQTVSIHHCAATWMNEEERTQAQRRVRLYSKYGRFPLLVYDGWNMLCKEGAGPFFSRLWERLQGK